MEKERESITKCSTNLAAVLTHCHITSPAPSSPRVLSHSWNVELYQTFELACRGITFEEGSKRGHRWRNLLPHSEWLWPA